MLQNSYVVLREYAEIPPIVNDLLVDCRHVLHHQGSKDRQFLHQPLQVIFKYLLPLLLNHQPDKNPEHPLLKLTFHYFEPLELLIIAEAEQFKKRAGDHIHALHIGFAREVAICDKYVAQFSEMFSDWFRAVDIFFDLSHACLWDIADIGHFNIGFAGFLLEGLYVGRAFPDTFSTELLENLHWKIEAFVDRVVSIFAARSTLTAISIHLLPLLVV